MGKYVIISIEWVSIFSPNTGQYKILFQDEHQNISYATSVYIDHHNSLWIGGDGKGVYKYSFDKMCIRDRDYSTRRFQNYNKENGVPLSAPNERSVYKTTNGDIYIGGVDGMISFKAESIDYIPQSYNIYPFRLLVKDVYKRQVYTDRNPKPRTFPFDDPRSYTLQSSTGY